MKSHGSEICRGAIAMLKAKGATEIQLRYGGKHIKLRAIYRDALIVATLPGTPSDWRSKRNAMASLKRQLRAAANDNNPMK
jgi:hypothetical protein